MMSKKEVEALSDEALKKEFEQVIAVMKSGVGANLSYMQGNYLFVHFLNVSSEMSKRGF